jgi:hypothetical protein
VTAQARTVRNVRAHVELEKKIRTLLDGSDCDGARRLIRNSLKAAPRDHWLSTWMAQTYYEEGNLKPALGGLRRPSLWHHGACGLAGSTHA